MLDKLEYSKETYLSTISGHQNIDVFTDTNSYENDSVEFRQTFQEHISSTLGEIVTLEQSNRGRLGVTYEVKRSLAGTRLFCKTHKEGDRYKRNIEKEFYYISKANECFKVGLYHLIFNKKKYSYMLQEWLQEVTSVDPENALRIINGFSRRLLLDSESHICILYCIRDLINTAKQELHFLVKERELTEDCALELQEYIKIFESDIDSLKQTLCHGDFGDKNIMKSQDGRYVVIDWEDCFMGIEGYDYLYWLTFFSHRRFYSKEVFKASGVSSANAKGIISVIMLIKTAMAVYSGLNKNNTMNSQERIEELISFCNY